MAQAQGRGCLRELGRRSGGAMVDRRGMLPQALSGGSAGLPCVRWRPRPTTADRLPEVSLRVEKEIGEQLPGTGTVPLEYRSFTGTQTLPWGMARARSTGVLREGGVIDGAVDRALSNRIQTDLDLVINVLTSVVSKTKPEDLRAFRRPFNKYRHAMSNLVDDELRRQKVVRALEMYPVASVYDLARCSPRRWSSISRELGGASHGDVMRIAVEQMQNVSPLDRAAFWTAVSTRAKTSDRGRVCGFAADQPKVQQRLS
uniref:Uncharacterized protein n=1 Tax=Alexandrium monilatum TaxID=311494 RepID=A0A7S4TB93_9DINO